MPFDSVDASLFTPEEVASKLRVTRRTVYRWLTSGKLKGVKAGAGWRVPAPGLEEFLNSTTRQPQTEEAE